MIEFAAHQSSSHNMFIFSPSYNIFALFVLSFTYIVEGHVGIELAARTVTDCIVGVLN